MKRTFTKQEAIEFLECNQNAMPSRIIEGLERYGFTNVEKIGRGKKLCFICEQSDDTNEQCYFIFKDILINEYGYGKSFDYDRALDIIGFHITNKEYVTLENIADELKIPSSSTISKHRKRLSQIGKQIDKALVKTTNDCDKKVFGGIQLEDKESTIKDITSIYETVIMVSYYKTIKELRDKYEVSAKHEFAIFAKYSTQDYQLIKRDKKDYSDFLLVRDLLLKDGYKFIGSYPLWHNVASTEPYINPYLKEMIFRVNLKCHGFDFVFYRRLYEITEELKYDDELLNIIKKAIKHKNENN